MPRMPRVFVERGIDHVQSSVTHGESVLGGDPEAERLIDATCEVKLRDRQVVLAWWIMSDRYPLAARCKGVPLWGSLTSVYLRVTKGFNVRSRVRGPFWQSQNSTKVI